MYDGTPVSDGSPGLSFGPAGGKEEFMTPETISLPSNYVRQCASLRTNVARVCAGTPTMSGLFTPPPTLWGPAPTCCSASHFVRTSMSVTTLEEEVRLLVSDAQAPEDGTRGPRADGLRSADDGPDDNSLSCSGDGTVGHDGGDSRTSAGEKSASTKPGRYSAADLIRVLHASLQPTAEAKAQSSMMDTTAVHRRSALVWAHPSAT